MEELGINVSESLTNLCKNNGTCGAELQGFLSKQIWNPSDRQSLLRSLSRLLLNSTATRDVTRAFRAITLELVSLTRSYIEEAQKSTREEKHALHQSFCVALATIISLCPEIKGFTLTYLTETSPPFKRNQDSSEPPPAKKSKKKKWLAPSQLEVCRATQQLLSHLPALGRLWDWSEFMVYLSDKDPQIRWFAVLTLGDLLKMAPTKLQEFKQKHFTGDEIIQLSIKYDTSLTESKEKALLLANPCPAPSEGSQRGSHTLREIIDSDLSDSVTCVCGVVLPRVRQHDQAEQAPVDELVPVPTTQRNLRGLALGIASASPVLLEGPVGCGKTVLVEHIAKATGRNSTPGLMKIQLGDQTDSKALVGTYRCTDVPGEFVWQPGVLTTAVRTGHWVLLEDLDYAPMDVVSLLLPLLEARVLSVPGHGDQVDAHPDFRMFATLRLMSSGSGYYRQHNAGMDVLEKLWTKVPVEPLSRAELHQVITHKHPQLSTIVDRLLDVYFLLSSGKHELSGDGNHGDESPETSNVGKYLSQDGRLISTRDLMKWCGRIAADFDVAKASTGTLVFEEALDCFCASINKADKLMGLAEAIAAKFNITKAKAEYFCCKHKPNVENTVSRFTVGRAFVDKKISEVAEVKRAKHSSFAYTRQSVCLLERVAVAVARNEPVLLVGETGTGKTSSVQFLAQQTGHTLRVINMNQQSDSTDLLGGFKPVDIRFVVKPFKDEFELTFCDTFSRKQNAKFIGHIQECFSKQRWKDLFTLYSHTAKSALKKCKDDTDKLEAWRVINKRLSVLKAQVEHTTNALAFSFIEGTLVHALRRGDWVLLDEINLATSETLECLSGLLESVSGSVVLLERGDTKPIVRHPDFRLFACMNPATDVGKKDLPPGVRNRFTELYVPELEESQDLKILVAEYLKGLSLTAAQVEGVVKFYLTIRNEASKKLTDGTGHKPTYSLRTLCRALQYAAGNPCSNVHRSLYEGFCLSFLTQLDRPSHPVVQQLVCQQILGRQTAKSLLKQPLPEPHSRRGNKYLNFEGYWVATGTREPETPEGYVLTASVRANLRDLCRVVSAGRHPVLIQGETSVGKTSLITWLAQASGNVCQRINNHEHTDIQEYVGCYSADGTGKLVFKEGVLVEAMRKGSWIILDELNLAPTDVLEALNRLLDDNRELFIAETQEVVKAHPRFMLFATQNPPGQYGGRKILSRAFRNRFVELHYSELPSSEVEMILSERCQLPMSYSKKLVAVMVELQTRRRGSGIFAGKQGFITLRDLFRWAERYRQASRVTDQQFFDWEQLLADNGYMLLAGRVRRPEECQVISDVLHTHLKRRVSEDALFSLSGDTSAATRAVLERLTAEQTPPGFSHVVWTGAMRRMAVLAGQALKFGEPVLLVGDTGCGKTTICQLYSAQRGDPLHSVNCHLHTESADFLGGLRPVRERTDDNNTRLFEWVDGPLVNAMRHGTMFLIDEISLADDSVLERLNSVLEPERTLLLAEKGGGDGGMNEIETLVAKESFRIVGTMNPGGDYGKKELSPALRNRFTEIWCPLSRDPRDLEAIMTHNLNQELTLGSAGVKDIATAIMRFVKWFSNNDIGKRCTVSIRDLLSWVNFINALTRSAITKRSSNDDDDVDMETDSTPTPPSLDPSVAYIHGACMVFLDSLGSGVTGSSDTQGLTTTRQKSLSFLVHQLQELTGRATCELKDLGLEPGHLGTVVDQERFGIEPFSIPRGPLPRSPSPDTYALSAPTTSHNALRALRALQLSRPVLLEGSPGVGKTSLVAALARAAGHRLVRINLSEQTDVSDLFGADLPVEGGEGGQFSWRDGPLLEALKGGHWVVLDELNLASQSVLEGLNACLDHRGEVYVPELARTFAVSHATTRIFACQNPLHQGGGRKGLPRSFLNRFTQVYVEPLTKDDLVFISSSLYPDIPRDVLTKMVDFNHLVHHQTMIDSKFGQRGSPWEFNLRDIFRWCDLLIANQSSNDLDPGEYVGLIYCERMRTTSDKTKMAELYTEVFDVAPSVTSRQVAITTNMVQVGHSFLERSNTVMAASVEGDLSLLHHILTPLESLMKCMEMNWMTILIGPSAAGKTSMVQLLAQLCGEQLDILPMNSSMDTTELLGGFEQLDLHRHLELFVRDTDAILQGALTLVYADRQHGHHDDGHSLLALWHRLWTLCEQNQRSETREELEVLQHQLTELEEVTETLVTVTAQLNLPQKKLAKRQRAPLHRLRGLLERTKSARNGGAFEWIDSVLVTALQKGHWLLIDNVNFCSPSVLDRLNALLEPNGVLSINERGAIDGQIPSIKPHKNFRLILAMDPKHGEISRAMRNRGIEVYIAGEEDGEPYSSHDIKSMFRGFGLVGLTVAEWLIDLHSKVKVALAGVMGRSSVSDLLRVSLLMTEQLERGCDVNTAMFQSALDVYVRPCRDYNTKQMLSSLVVESLQNDTLAEAESASSESSLLDLGQWPDGLPTATGWCQDVSMAAVQQSTALLLYYLNKYSVEYGKRSSFPLTFSHLQTGNSNGEPSSDLEDHQTAALCLEPATRILLEQTSVQTWPETVAYLSRVIPDRTNNKNKPSAGPLCDFAQSLPEVVIKVLKTVFEHPLFKDVGTIVTALMSKKDTEIWKQMSFDLRWNKDFMKKIQRSRSSVEPSSDDNKRAELFQKFNQLYLVARIAQNSLLHCHGLDQMVKAPRRRDATPLEYSAAVHKGLCEADQLPHPCVVHLYPLVTQLDRQLGEIFSRDLTLDDDKMNNVSDALNTYDWFVRFCKQPIRSVHKELFVPTLAVHWAWLRDGLLDKLQEENRLLAAMLPVINSLQAALGTSSKSAEFHLQVTEAFGPPSPYPTPLTARLLLQAHSLSQALTLSHDSAKQRSKVGARLALLQREGSMLRGQLAQVIGRLWTEDAEDIKDWAQKELESIQLALAEHKLLPTSLTPYCEDAKMDHSSDNPPPAVPETTTTALLPVHDLHTLNMELWVVSMATEGVVVDDDDVRRLVDYVLERSSLSVEVVDVCRRMKSLPGATLEMLSHYLRDVWTSTATDQPEDWLSWKQREITAESTMDCRSSVNCKGPAAMFTPLLSNFVFHLFMDQPETGNERGMKHKAGSVDSWLPSNIPLSKMNEKLAQMKSLSHSVLDSIGHQSRNGSTSGHAVKLIMSVLQTLLQSVRSALSIEEDMSDSNQSCIESMTSQIAKITMHPKMAQLSPEVNATLTEISRKLIPRTDISSSHTVEEFRVGELWAYVGMLQMLLLAPQGPVDPAHKLSLELDYLQQEINSATTELTVRSQHHELMTGCKLSLDGSTHPVIRHLVAERDRKQAWIEKHSGLVATRPEPPQFHLLLQDTRQFVASVASADRLSALLSALQLAYDQTAPAVTMPTVVKEYKAWLRTAAEFVRSAEKNYPFYRDVVMPLLVGVRQIQFGISLMGHSLEVKLKLNQLQVDCGLQQAPPLEELLQLLCRFPFVSRSSLSSLDVASQLLQETTRWSLERVSTTEACEGQNKPAVLQRLLLCALHHARSHLAVTLTLDAPITYFLSRLFHAYVGAWRRAEDERRMRLAEKESLYKFRTTTHGESLTEEQRDDRDRRERFPSYEQEFEDITVGFVLDDTKPKPSDDTKPDPEEDDEDLQALSLSVDEMDTISSFHQMAFSGLTHTAWHQGEPQSVDAEVNYAEPVVTGYKLAAPLVKSLSWALDPKLDSALLGSHLLVSQVLRDSAKDDAPKWKKSNKPYDVYFDPNIPEVLKCRAVLERLDERIQSLLEEWPDHPTLKQIIIVQRRILAFPITSPIMKYVTGLEILLQKAQEWESNAARHVSLTDHMDALKVLVIDLRRLELSCWQSCLDTVAWRCGQRAAHWWFHLYQLLEAFLSPSQDAQEHTEPDLRALAESLTQFLEGGGLGEFRTRLAMLEAYHCQVTHMEASDTQVKIQNLLYNLHQHYKQFSDNINSEITRLRTPIEKDLKGFVKIARWNDFNYYAVKQTVEKTHKFLHKHMKEFETVLGHPVHPLLTEDAKPDWSNPGQDGGAPGGISVELFLETVKLTNEPSVSALDSELQQRLSTLSARYIKHCRRVMTKRQHSQLSGALDEFTGEVIESVHELQTLDVNPNAEKDKQKSEAKHINLRKRKALSDLFKYLQKLGLSHRKGLTSMNAEAESKELAKWMITQPIEVTTALAQMETHHCDAEMTTRWQGCERYYRRCVGRQTILAMTMRAPSQELGIGNIDRCKGFSQHLSLLVLAQRAQLAETFTQFLELRKLSSTITSVSVEKPAAHMAISEWMRTLKLVSVQAIEGLQQTAIVLECCPDHSTDGSTQMTSPYPTRHQCGILATGDGGETRREAIREIKGLVDKVRQVKANLDKLMSSQGIATSATKTTLQEAIATLQQVNISLSSILPGFTMGDSTIQHPLSKTLVYVNSILQKTVTDFEAWCQDADRWITEEQYGPDSKMVGFSERTDLLITDLLLVIQKFVKKGQVGDTVATEVKGQDEEEEEEEGILEKHLTKHIQESLDNCISDLKIDTIVGQLSSLVTSIQQWSSSPQDYPAASEACKLLSHCGPLVAQYSRFVQFVLTEYVSMHRASAKLLSVLLAVFTELGRKGFCLPAEFGDEAGGEGATEFEDITGGGLGEGSGAKDVSDQIETEDQLEDTRRRGEEPEEQDQSQEPDIAPEDNAIEMSDTFDGKMHDPDQQGEEGSEDSDSDQEPDVDREMGDLEGADADKLDEQIWGSDQEDEEEHNQDKKEEFGPGAGQQTETELVAKDDNDDQSEADNQNKDDKQQSKEEEKEDQVKEAMDQSEYNEDESDPHYNDQSEAKEAEPMDLPEELNLDDQEEGGSKEDEGEDEGTQGEENPLDIDKMKDNGEDVDEKETDEMNGEDSQEDVENKDEENATKEDLPPDGSNEEKGEEQNAEEPMETEEEIPDVENSTNQEPGFEPKDENDEAKADEDKAPEPNPSEAMYSGKTEHDGQNVEQGEEAQNAAGEDNDDKQNEGSGLSESQQDKGRQGDDSTSVTKGTSQQQKNQKSERRPGQSSENRTTGSADDKVQRKLHTVDSETAPQDDQADDKQPRQSDLYEHLRESSSHHDAQTLDVATADQEQPTPNADDDDDADKMAAGDEDDMRPDDNTKVKDEPRPDDLQSARLSRPSGHRDDRADAADDGQAEMDTDDDVEIDGQRVVTATVQRPPESSVHTQMEVYADQPTECDLERLRSELEEGLTVWTGAAALDRDEEAAAQEAWCRYEALTAGLSQDLCEQLRLVLEPTQASKLRGDFRTGKRLNMRKVIPYIASQFRKDKIWLRRTKPSKRQYQVMVAVDDSSSMDDNHSKQLAFESLSVIANALALLEVGELAISSFGETVKLLHPFNEQFTSQSGGRILQQFTFEQKKTKIAQLLDRVSAEMLSARSRQSGPPSETSQLLLVVSDGRGLYLEGTEVVRAAVRRAREAGVFLVFVVVDNPQNKDSILDIKVPVFKGAGQLPEIRSYMDSFPSRSTSS